MIEVVHIDLRRERNDKGRKEKKESLMDIKNTYDTPSNLSLQSTLSFNAADDFRRQKLCRSS
jgi:hypothetical protein